MLRVSEVFLSLFPSSPLPPTYKGSSNLLDFKFSTWGSLTLHLLWPSGFIHNSLQILSAQERNFIFQDGKFLIASSWWSLQEVVNVSDSNTECIDRPTSSPNNVFTITRTAEREGPQWQLHDHQHCWMWRSSLSLGICPGVLEAILYASTQNYKVWTSLIPRP